LSDLQTIIEDEKLFSRIKNVSLIPSKQKHPIDPVYLAYFFII